MVAVTSLNLGHGALSAKRAQYAGLPGIAGLFSNLHVLAIAVFASLGGFVYGCKYFLSSLVSMIHLTDKISKTTKACSARS